MSARWPFRGRSGAGGCLRQRRLKLAERTRGALNVEQREAQSELKLATRIDKLLARFKAAKRSSPQHSLHPGEQARCGLEAGLHELESDPDAALSE